MKRNLKKFVSMFLALTLILSVAAIAPISAGAAEANSESSAAVDTKDCYIPSDNVTDTHRYYFYMPGEWYTNNEINTAGIYWYSGDDACNEWPGYKAQPSEDVLSLYYVDCPANVPTIIWNNFFDGGTDKTDYKYVQAVQTVDINVEDIYFELVYGFASNFNNMIYIINPEYTTVSVTGKLTYQGDWYFYYGDGTYGTKLTKEESEQAGTLEILPDEPYKEFEYELLDDGTAEITGYNGKTIETTIPSEIDGYTVTSIGYGAFSGCTSLTNITIPDSVTSIESGSLDDTAWYDNQPDGVVYAGKVAYKYKGEMPENTSITLKDDTKGITGQAFYGCENLASITIPNSVKIIDWMAFAGCISLTSVTIPDSVTTLEYGAFWRCSSLKDVTISPNIKYLGGEAGVGKGAGVFCECTNLASITIPYGVIDIGVNAFNGCSNLKSVTIPESVTGVGSLAFSGCTSLESLTVPDTVTNIYNQAFGYYFDEDDYQFKKVSCFTIYGYTGTAAETYANENGFLFIALDKQQVGDANGDGEINAKDRMMLTRYLAKWSGYESVDMTAADVNNDGDVNAKDRMILTRHLAKWQGYETLPFDKI